MNRLRQLRERAGLSVEELAEKVGVGPAWIEVIEADDDWLERDDVEVANDLIPIADALHCTLDELCGRESAQRWRPIGELVGREERGCILLATTSNHFHVFRWRHGAWADCETHGPVLRYTHWLRLPEDLP